MGTNWMLSPLAVLLLISTVRSQTQSEPSLQDAREGDDVTLRCRFDPVTHLPNVTSYWVHRIDNDIENVAFGNLNLQDSYRVIYEPSAGRYDLVMKNVSYEQDNGRFECRVRLGGSGRLLHMQAFNVVILTPPSPPVVEPGPHILSQEERELNLTCSTTGGSPEPTIQWFREGTEYPLESRVVHGKTRDFPSIATLTLTPAKEDDGTAYHCVVWNRAMPTGQKHDAYVELSVNYYPRVEVGPDNPLRVELNGTALLECKVDAKPRVNSVRWTRNGKYISNSFTHTIPGVTVEDAGKYTCTADNGLGRPGEKEVYLDVLYPPTVTVESKTYEAEEGGNVEIRCTVSSNPAPISIEWTMESDRNFRQNGDTLVLKRVNADMAGTYVCRAVNLISSSSGKSVEKASSASVAVLVRHKPGRARITPDRPVAQEGTAVTLTCSAKPPGWPAPQYRWFRDNGIPDPTPVVIATASQYTIPSAHLGSEGVYRCQATNELGQGELASATLEVHQPPHFQSKLPLHMTKRSGEYDFSITCNALGKPRPHVKWYKDNMEIKPDANLYEVKTDHKESTNSVVNVQSTLLFRGKARQNVNELIPEDRGIYTCAFENEVKRVDSSITLRIEHPPMLIKQQNKVAFDMMETAQLSCRVLSFPKPDFQWTYGSSTSPLQMSGDGHYDINTTSDNNDSYYSVLRIRSVSPSDYGDYHCKVSNSLGSIMPMIRLQPKGAPESPTALTAQKVGSSFVTLKWEPGFNGGLSSTKYFVLYRRVGRTSVDYRCDGDRPGDLDWLEYDCGRVNPCNVTRLEQHSSYTFKVKAVNAKGQSNYSNEIAVTTKVDEIPPPEQVTFDPATRTLVFTAGPTCLSLIGVAEGLGAMGGWQVVDTVPLQLSGTSSVIQEATLAAPPKPIRSTGRHYAEPPLDELNPRLRLKLCLQPNQDICSNYTEAEIGTSYTKEAAALTTATLIAIVVSCLVFLLFLSLLFIFCRCKKHEHIKETSKDYEMDSMRPPMQNQAPPPYYPSTGMENKALEHSMDLALEDSKSAVYATQAGYGYHIAPHAQPHPAQTMPGSEWANTGYIENSYTNSNNGGSVNSQDSLWQMKMAAANNPSGMPTHQIPDHQSNYGYDPIAHGGYGTIDDYAPYPHMPHQQQAPTDYNVRGSQNPSRQEYCSDPYASVHKPKKRIDQHIESPYHEVSGLPETYGAGGGGGGEEVGGEDKPPHLSLSYDESLESGYSTPNSRSRRVIREIIV